MAFFLKQLLPYLEVKHLIKANSMLHHLNSLRASIKYRKPSSFDQIILTTFSDAPFNISISTSYGQTGPLTTICFDSETVIHPIDGSSYKQKRVCFSSYGAEIHACADAKHREFYDRSACLSIISTAKNIHQMVVDSKGFFETLTTLHEEKDYRLRQTVQRIRNSFQSGEMDSLKWNQGRANIADALTKYNLVMHKMLNRFMYSESFEISAYLSFEIDSASWN